MASNGSPGVRNPTSVSLQRLQTLAPAEHALYTRLFRTVAGGATGSTAPGSSVAGLLQRSGLPQETLRRIWELSDNTNDGTLDLESFCVACRLSAHAQLGVVVNETAIADVPAAPPHFEGLDRGTAFAGGGQSIGICNGDSLQGDFDFEAAAFGVDGDHIGSPSRPPLPSVGSSMSLEPSPGCPPSVSAYKWQSGGSDFSTGIDSARMLTHSRSMVDGSEERSSTSRRDKPALHGKSEGWEGPRSASKLSEALSGGQGRDRMDKLGREVVEARQSLDQTLQEKSRCEWCIEKARAQLEARREDRQQVRIELLRRQADLKHLWGTLDFGRQQIEEAEREIATLREARKSFAAEEILHVERRFGQLASARASSSERSSALETARTAHERSAADLQRIRDLGELVKRTARRKLELQAKQQLLLAAQRQAEQDRSYAHRELEMVRTTLSRLKSDRLRLGKDKFAAFEDADSLARGAGLGPGIVRELVSPSSEPHGGGNCRDHELRSHDRYCTHPKAADDVTAWWRAMSDASESGATGNVPHRASSGWTRFRGSGGDFPHDVTRKESVLH